MLPNSYQVGSLTFNNTESVYFRVDRHMRFISSLIESQSTRVRLDKVKLVAVLTIVGALIGFVFPYPVFQIATVFHAGMLFLFPYVPIVGWSPSIAGIVIAIAHLKRKGWAWKANVALQSISIALIIAIFVSYATIRGQFDISISESISAMNYYLLLPAIATTILILLTQYRLKFQFQTTLN